MGAGSSTFHAKSTDASSKDDGPGSGKKPSKHMNFDIGDIVQVSLEDDMYREGFVVERLNDLKVRVDCGEFTHDCLIENCKLISKATDFEIGDKVSARTEDSFLYFVGKVIAVDMKKKTIDVLMESDVPDDIEYGIKFEYARKLMNKRALVQSRWRRAFMVVRAVRRFSFGMRKPSFDENESSLEN